MVRRRSFNFVHDPLPVLIVMAVPRPDNKKDAPEYNYSFDIADIAFELASNAVYGALHLGQFMGTLLAFVNTAHVFLRFWRPCCATQARSSQLHPAFSPPFRSRWTAPRAANHFH